jgi:transcriptional regulator with XRE-family HTH domain
MGSDGARGRVPCSEVFRELPLPDKRYANICGVAVNTDRNPLTHFGRQVRKELIAHGWSLREMAARSGLAAPYWSQIENGHRPPTEAVAEACDRVFPERHGWFSEYYEESKSWTPPGFRDWAELEEKSASLQDWYPGILTGLLQTEDYARGLLGTSPGVTDEIVATRLTARMERQRRVLMREDPPSVWFVVDEMALYRRVGSPAIMAEQMRHLAEVASRPNVTMQVLPAVAHPANASGFVIADSSAWCEHVKGGFVYEGETVTPLAALFDTLRGECLKVSESAALFERMTEIWTAGARAVTATRTAVSASKSRRATG